MKAVRESGGWGEAATDQEIVEGIRLLARTEGIFNGAGGGTTVAVTKKLIEQGRIPRDESILISVTGNGYKTWRPWLDSVEQPFRIRPGWRFRRALRAHRRRPPGERRLTGGWQEKGGRVIMVQVQGPDPAAQVYGGAGRSRHRGTPSPRWWTTRARYPG